MPGPSQPGEQPTDPQPPRLAVRRAAPAAADRPPPGSVAELRARLERLPDGHPSSPYDDDGWLKPPPARLRQLELGLPARSLGTRTPAAYERFGIDPEDDWLTGGLPSAAPADEDTPVPAESNGHNGTRAGDLAPEHRDLVERILAACRAAEGRNARGGYGSSGLTPALRRISAQLPAGGLAPGSEADTLKPAERFAARLARLIDRQPGRPPADLAATISDGIRYAFTFPAADYAEGTRLVHRKLKAQGFDLEARRNQWDSREYKGIFTRWRDPAHGLAFEVQFHTTESWAVVRQTHDAYLQITDPDTPAAERSRLRARQAAAASAISPPPGSLDIADFRAAAR